MGKKYSETEPLLSEELFIAVDLGNEIEKDFFNRVDNANTKLVTLELESIKSVQDGNLVKAIAILESQEYLDNKKIYAQNLLQYIESRNLEHENLMKESTSDVDQSLIILSKHIVLGISLMTLSIFIIIGGSLILGFYFSRSILKPISKLEDASKQIIAGNFDIQSSSDSKDEMGNLSRTFESMVENLKDMTDIPTQISLQKNLRKALDESSIVSIIDTSGKITYANNKFCQVSKYSKEELIGQRQDILRSKFHPSNFYADLWKIISKGDIWHGEICNAAKDGTLFWNDTTVILFLDKDGKISEYVSVRNNIAEQKNLTQKLIHAERFSAIGELSSRMSHDIRNPLSIIQGEIQLLKSKNILDEKQTRRITSSISRITHQLNDVLDYLRDTPLENSRFNLSILLNRVLNSLDIPSGVKINIVGDEIFMVGDEHKMNIVLINLIFNSIQAVDDDGGEIDVILSKTDTEIIIMVRDSGDGILIKPIDKIFDPLITSKQKGTGLGLASVKNVVNQHGGIISVKNNPTTFTIKIPQKEFTST